MRLSPVVATLIPIAALFAAGDPFLGTWTLDMNASKFPPIIVTIEPIDAGIRYSSDRTQFSAKFDGQAAPVSRSPTVSTVTLRKIDDRTIERTMTKDGKVIIIVRMQVSDDGRRMTVSSPTDVFRPTDYERVSEENNKGFFGRWKLKTVQTTRVFEKDGEGYKVSTKASPFSFSFTVPKLDGKTFASFSVGGPNSTRKIAYKRIDSSTIDEEWHDGDGKVGRGRITVSADGKTLTDADDNADGSKTIAVYRKQ